MRLKKQFKTEENQTRSQNILYYRRIKQVISEREFDKTTEYYILYFQSIYDRNHLRSQILKVLPF